MHSKIVFFAFAALTVTVKASTIPEASAGAHVPLIAAAPVVDSYNHIPNYKSSYSVDDLVTGDRKTASETRQGGVTKGFYSVLQPDGVIRTVKYIVTPLGGFQAEVINTGSAVHPAPIRHGKGRLLVASPLISASQHAPVLAEPEVAANTVFEEASSIGLGASKFGAKSVVSSTLGLHEALDGLADEIGSPALRSRGSAKY